MNFVVVDNNESDLDMFAQNLTVIMLSASDVNRVDAIFAGAW